MAGSGENALSERRVAARERQQKAGEMLLAGASIEKIRQTLGYKSWLGARCAVEKWLGRLPPPEDVRRMRRRGSARLERLLDVCWEAALEGDMNAIREARMLIREWGHMNGVYVTNPDHYETTRDQELLDQEARRRAFIQALMGDPEAQAAGRVILQRISVVASEPAPPPDRDL